MRGKTKEAGLITDSQAKIMHLLIKGLTYPEIALELHTTRDAIEMQMVRIRERYQVRTNVQAVIKMLAGIDDN